MPTEDASNTAANIKTSAINTAVKDHEPKISIVKKQSVVLSPNDARTRRKSSAYAAAPPNLRSRSPRPFDNITEESDSIHVPPVGKIVWFAKQGLWQALDSYLDKMCQESSKIQLKFDPELLSV